MMHACWLAFAITVLGCSKAQDDQTYYAINVEKNQTKGDGSTEVVLRFLGRKGYHWNSEFRAFARVVSKEGVVLEKEEFSKKDGDFVDSGEEGRLQFVAKPDGSSSKPKVTLKARFSVCTKKECRVFEDVPVEVSLDAR